MANWLTDVSTKLEGLLVTKPPAAYLGAFGKHPGWNDHLDDLGLESEPLVAAKQYLYVQGIGGVIDAGQWDALPAEDALADFRHIFVWKDLENLLIGRLWSSSDGKGRMRYPMVACAHFFHRTAPGLPDALPLLDRIEADCRATDSPEKVRRVIAEARPAAHALLSQAASESRAPDRFAAKLGLDPQSEAAERIAYAAEGSLGLLSATGQFKGGISLRLAQTKATPQHLRLPADQQAPLATIEFWSAFLEPWLASDAPVLFVQPLDHPWVDVIAGLPTAKHLFCLKAGRNPLPLANDIPFNLTNGSREQARSHWNRLIGAAV